MSYLIKAQGVHQNSSCLYVTCTRGSLITDSCARVRRSSSSGLQQSLFQADLLFLTPIHQGIVYEFRDRNPVSRAIPRQTALRRFVVGSHVDLGFNRSGRRPNRKNRRGVADPDEGSAYTRVRPTKPDPGRDGWVKGNRAQVSGRHLTVNRRRECKLIGEVYHVFQSLFCGKELPLVRSCIFLYLLSTMNDYFRLTRRELTFTGNGREAP